MKKIILGTIFSSFQCHISKKHLAALELPYLTAWILETITWNCGSELLSPRVIVIPLMVT